jgi:hypothetical protein
MPIPNADRAIIDPVKLHGVPALTQPSGRPLQGGALLALGYSSEQWRHLEADLRSQHLSRGATREDQTPYGRKYVIRGTLVGPSGSSVDLVSVWVLRTGEDIPRFVTAYPEVGR